MTAVLLSKNCEASLCTRLPLLGLIRSAKRFLPAFIFGKESTLLSNGDELHADQIFLKALVSIENNKYIQNGAVSTRLEYWYSQAMKACPYCFECEK